MKAKKRKGLNTKKLRQRLIVTLSGKGFLVKNNYVDFFGAKGERLQPRKFAMNDSDSRCLVEHIINTTVINLMENCIVEAINAGKKDQLAQIVLSPRQAVIYYLQKGLDLDDFHNVTETEKSILIPDKEIRNGNRILIVLTIHIMKNPSEPIYAADENGVAI
jgi:hypothetical protein